MNLSTRHCTPSNAALRLGCVGGRGPRSEWMPRRAGRPAGARLPEACRPTEFVTRAVGRHPAPTLQPALWEATVRSDGRPTRGGRRVRGCAGGWCRVFCGLTVRICPLWGDRSCCQACGCGCCRSTYCRAADSGWAVRRGGGVSGERLGAHWLVTPTAVRARRGRALYSSKHRLRGAMALGFSTRAGGSPLVCGWRTHNTGGYPLALWEV